MKLGILLLNNISHDCAMLNLSKEEMEICAGRTFLESYNPFFKTNYSILRHGNEIEREPDLVCSDGLYIEIRGNYYSEELQKKIAFQMKKNGIGHSELIFNGDGQAFTFLLNGIEEKNQKNYFTPNKKHFILLIDLTNCKTPLTTNSDYKDFSEKGIISSDIFDSIWIINNRYIVGPGVEYVSIELNQGNYCIFQIYPKA